MTYPTRRYHFSSPTEITVIFSRHSPSLDEDDDEAGDDLVQERDDGVDEGTVLGARTDELGGDAQCRDHRDGAAGADEHSCRVEYCRGASSELDNRGCEEPNQTAHQIADLWKGIVVVWWSGWFGFSIIYMVRSGVVVGLLMMVGFDLIILTLVDGLVESMKS